MSFAALKDTVEKRVHVGQGEHFITSDPNVVLSTILGSCVAMCVRDPLAGVGGMNHFLLPEGSGAGTSRLRERCGSKSARTQAPRRIAWKVLG